MSEASKLFTPEQVLSQVAEKSPFAQFVTGNSPMPDLQTIPFRCAVDVGAGPDVSHLALVELSRKPAYAFRKISWAGIDDFARFDVEIAALVFSKIRSAIERTVIDWIGDWSTDVEYLVAVERYMEHHSRLPGSTRTKRLRKKRKTKVLAWYRRNFS